MKSTLKQIIAKHKDKKKSMLQQGRLKSIIPKQALTEEIFLKKQLWVVLH